MQKDKEKTQLEISVIGRLISLEAFAFVMALVSLVYGAWEDSYWNIALGMVILLGTSLFVLKCRNCRGRDRDKAK
ncbi:hypothetical protein GPEL0_01r2281 [Geoanaerobacter pelophilus]|uniref:Uncharacterized protein n=1 Tax=Geoanaerobacter pelophilus TaxID=60036 RepID=A0ABQ0MI61_9BACT|nr:hypothetical protein [Geoanaerobacter pelophilus]GAW66780.1 hypothetical protein GPEL0_01r2281 [Geoanaerobacter pelophilus]